MRTLALLMLLVAAGMAEDAPKKLLRGLQEGKFVDEYFGVTYEASGMMPGYGAGGPNQLFVVRCAGGIEVELSVQEMPKILASAEWHTLLKTGWEKDGKERGDVEHGSDPYAWSLCTEESLAGFQRHHAYALFPRGHQCFVLHAQLQEKSETSAATLKDALGRLTVDEKKVDTFLAAHLIAKQLGKDPTEPSVLLGAAATYTSQPSFENPTLALAAAELAAKGEEKFSADERWSLAQLTGLALLSLGRNEESIPHWKKTITISAETINPAVSESNARYNLACAYAKSGKLDEAFTELKGAFDVGTGEQVLGLKSWAQEDADLAPLREDPRWKALYPDAE